MPVARCPLLESELQAPNTVMLELEIAFARYLARRGLPGRLTGMSPSRRHECRKIRWLPKLVCTVQSAGGGATTAHKSCVRAASRAGMGCGEALAGQ